MNWYLVYNTDAGRTIYKCYEQFNKIEAEAFGKSYCECMGLDFVEVYEGGK